MNKLKITSNKRVNNKFKFYTFDNPNFYTFDKILENNIKYYMIFNQRSNGKQYFLKELNKRKKAITK